MKLMLHAARSISCLLSLKRNLHPLAGTQRHTLPPVLLSHILSAASLVAQTPSNIFLTFGKTSFCHFWGLLSCLPPISVKLSPPLRHPWGWAFVLPGPTRVLPQPPDFSASHTCLIVLQTFPAFNWAYRQPFWQQKF